MRAAYSPGAGLLNNKAAHVPCARRNIVARSSRARHDRSLCTNLVARRCAPAHSAHASVLFLPVMRARPDR
jgi:hypothetical protein